MPTHISGYDFNSDIEICVPPHVVQWKTEVVPGELVIINWVTNKSVYESRLLVYNERKDIYEPGELLRLEKEGGDNRTIFILREWDE